MRDARVEHTGRCVGVRRGIHSRDWTTSPARRAFLCLLKDRAIYAKVFASLWQGTLVGRTDEQLVFIFLLANAGLDGCVDVTAAYIGALTGMGEARARSALNYLESPDASSRSPELDGARIDRIDQHRDWGWTIVNYGHYRSLKDEATVRAQTRDRVKKHRDLKRSVTPGNASLQQGEGDGEVVLSGPDATHPPPHVSGADGAVVEESVKEWQKAFERWWIEYPRKVAKSAALLAWMKVRPRTQATYDLLVKGLRLHKKSEWRDRPSDKIPHAATWLNQRRHTDAETPTRA